MNLLEFDATLRQLETLSLDYSDITDIDAVRAWLDRRQEIISQLQNFDAQLLSKEKADEVARRIEKIIDVGQQITSFAEHQIEEITKEIGRLPKERQGVRSYVGDTETKGNAIDRHA